MSFILKGTYIEARITRGDYEYEFFDSDLVNYDPMKTVIRRRIAYSNGSWTELGPMEVPLTRYILTGYIKFDMAKSMTFQEFLAGAFPDTEENLR